MTQSSESSMLFNCKCFFLCVAIKIAVFIWWRVNGRNSNKVTWSDSIFFRLLATRECFIGKIYHANILPTDISRNWSKNLLISDGIIVKSEITNTWVILSSTNCSLLTKVIFKWVLTKPFRQNIFDMMLQKKLNSFYDGMNCNFQTLKRLPRDKHVTTSISWEIARTLFNRC